MANLSSSSVAVAISGGVLILGGIAAAPALAYPPGVDLTVGCNAPSFAPGATATCTLTNIDPAGPNDITIGDLVAAGNGATIARASVLAQDSNTFTKTLTVPTTPGKYLLTGTSGSETVTAELTVAAGGGGGGGGDEGGGSGTTPKTGANVTLGLVAGLGALGLGGGLFAASRRKKV